MDRTISVLSNASLESVGLFGLTLDQVTARVTGMGEKPYRAKQILEWVYRHRVDSIDRMTSLSTALRAQLAERFHVYESTVASDQTSVDGTRKLLLRWADGQTTECVLIPDGDRRTACISTQVGCPVGCVFCASGLEGVTRNLTAAQIVEQAMRVALLCERDTRLSNVVFMGLGEPLANYDNTLAAARIINADFGLHVAARKITISTVGLPKQMRRMADEGLQFTLALSLHAPDDALRAKLIPWAEGVTISQLTEACQYYFDKTGREVTLEYVLLGDLNDSPACARALSRLCRKMRCNVNLIRYNPVAGLPYKRPDTDAAKAFLDLLRAEGVNAHLRRSRGRDIDGACGQLRRKMIDMGG